ncbi:alpha-amylase family glycosyl hydrolase [Myxococcus sp. Y35]|uniref:alpha-amylase family glycosyl hydrolase n=1 Tax=Pseudomyxococcus flavus TaxID=3115648 RepID=UPI003CEDFAC0
MLNAFSRRLAAILSLSLLSLAGLPAEAAVRNAATTEASAAAPTCGPVKDPDWMEGAVVYGVVPPLFGEQPFQAVTARLDYLRELGVDVLWLSPVNKTTDPGDFGYAVTDYFDVRPDYGTKADFKELVDQAHARGMKVMMDFVPNHTSNAHPYFQDVLSKGKQSPYFGYYDRDAQGQPTHYFDWKHLPNLNYDNPDVVAMVQRAFQYWVREFDVDGFRVDVAWGVKERQPGFWCDLSTALRKEKPDVYLLAEASAHDPYFVSNGFNAAYDWSASLGHWAWEHVFEDRQKVAPRLYAALKGGQTPVDRVARFLNNNDTAKRFIGRYGPGATRVAAALLLTLPGVPIVYTGDEVGAEYEPYQEPPPLAWDADPHGLREHYRRLIALRDEHPALAAGAWLPVPVKGNPSALAYLRHQVGASEPVLVVLNFGPAATLRLSLPEAYANLSNQVALRDLLTEKNVTVRSNGKRLEVAMPASGAVLLTPRS